MSKLLNGIKGGVSGFASGGIPGAIAGAAVGLADQDSAVGKIGKVWNTASNFSSPLSLGDEEKQMIGNIQQGRV